MAMRALPLLLLLAVVVVAAAPAQGETIELGSRRWLQQYGAMAPAEAPTESAYGPGMGYISYGALTADRVPCSVTGASYYNCVTGAEANPYDRGCSSITLCRN